MTISVLQSAKSPDSNDASAASVACTFGSAPTAGATIVGHVAWLGSVGALQSVTDGTNTYSIVGTAWTVAAGDAFFMAIFVAQNISGASALTVTANFSSSQQYRRICVSEIGGAATTGQPDASSHSADDATFGTTTDGTTSGAATPSVDGCLIWGVAHAEDSGTAPTAGTGFTPIDTASFSAGDAWRTEYLVQATAASVAATFTGPAAARHIGVGMLAIAPAAAGGGGQPFPPSLHSRMTTRVVRFS